MGKHFLIICFFVLFARIDCFAQSVKDSIKPVFSIELGTSVFRLPRIFTFNNLKYHQYYFYTGVRFRYKRKHTNRISFAWDNYGVRGKEVPFVGQRDFYLETGLEWQKRFIYQDLSIAFGCGLIYHRGYAKTRDSNIDSFEYLANGIMFGLNTGFHYSINERWNFIADVNIAYALEKKNTTRIQNGIVDKSITTERSFYVTKPLVVSILLKF